MRTLTVSALVAKFTIGFGCAALADTVYYQPTPYPLMKPDSRPLPQDINIVHLWDGWLGSQYYTVFYRDDKLQFGGWGDVYRAYVKFDLTGLPKNVTRAIFWFSSYARGDTSTTTPFALCKVTGPWSTTMSWATQPSVPSSCAGWFTMPKAGDWWGIDATSWYSGWQNQPNTNHGFFFTPQYINNRFNNFRSSRYSNDALRPIIQLEFTRPTGMPTFKMPLPGGYSWLVTTEAGGYDCKGRADTAHQNANYFAIDFSARNRGANSGAGLTGDIPILAAAGGTVHEVGGPNDGRGYYITLNHSGGYQTRYLHFKKPPARKSGTLLKKGDTVSQGDQIGIMGTTGDSTGVHLHFNVWLNGAGGSSVTDLSYVVMDGWLLRSFQTECSLNNGIPVDWIRYYRSSNTPTGK